MAQSGELATLRDRAVPTKVASQLLRRLQRSRTDESRSKDAMTQHLTLLSVPGLRSRQILRPFPLVCTAHGVRRLGIMSPVAL